MGQLHGLVQQRERNSSAVSGLEPRATVNPCRDHQALFVPGTHALLFRYRRSLPALNVNVQGVENV